MTIDLRAADEMRSDLTVSYKSFNTKLPSNIDDADIDPSITEWLTPRNGQTDIAVYLVRYEICALYRRLLTEIAELGLRNDVNSMATFVEHRHMLIEIYDRMEDKFLLHATTTDDPLF